MRCIRRLVLIFSCFVCAASAQHSANNPLNNWSEFLRTNMERYNPYENKLSVTNVPRLKLKWVYPIGTDTPSSAVTADGVVYVQTVSGSTGAIYALEPGTGKLLWVYGEDIDGGSTSTPAVANGAVYFGNFFGVVEALNATTGALLWSSNQIGDFIKSSPAVLGNVIYIGSSFSFNGAGGGVSALDASTGAQLWFFPTTDEVESSPAVVGNVVYVGADDHNVYALKRRTGAQLWSYTTGGPVHSSPALANGVVYIGSSDDNLYALNASTGAKLWSYTTGGRVTASPALANGVVYVGSEDGNLYALAAGTGAKLWSFATGGGVSSAAVANGVVYVGSPAANGHGANLYALNAGTGTLLFNYIPDVPAAAVCGCSPTVSNGQVYFGSSTHGLAAFGLN